MLQSQLFQGEPTLEAVAANTTRISRTVNNLFEPVHRVQLALLMWDASVLPQFGADGIYGDETAGAVVQFKLNELGVPPDEIVDDVGPATVTRLDEIALANEEPTPPPPPPPPPTLFVRRHAWALEPTDAWHPIMEAYAQAVQVMQARPAADPTSWAFQAALHGTYMQPLSAAWNDCQHGNWFFLPWHRLYLYYFERIVRAAVQGFGGPADFALPYWNYEASSPADSIPFAFRRPVLSDGATPNPLFLDVPFRRAGVSNGTARIDRRITSTAAMAMTLFVDPPAVGFGGGVTRRNHSGPQGAFGGVESLPHNPVHGAIGGPFVPQCGGALMTDPNCAALDPIFWLHHANIDRLWNAWLALGNGRANPSNPSWANEPFTFFDENGAQVTKTSAEVVDSAAQLGYVYDDQPQALVPIGMAAMNEEEPPELAGASEQPLAVTNEPSSVTVSLPAASTDLVNRALAGEANVYMTVEDIRAAANTGIAYAVYLNLADPNDADERSRQLAGVISLFGIEQMNEGGEHAGVPGLRHTFNITEIARQLAAAGRWDPSAVTVTIEPFDPISGDDESVERAPMFAALPPVAFGRVSFFVR